VHYEDIPWTYRHFHSTIELQMVRTIFKENIFMYRQVNVNCTRLFNRTYLG
jgi:hypothetical protein